MSAGTDYFAVYARPKNGRVIGHAMHLCNVVARSQQHAMTIARANGLTPGSAVRIGREGYAKALSAAGFQVEDAK
jgi:hypothetical protein